MPGADRLEVEIIEKRWRCVPGALPVLSDLCFTADPGERIALFAPSGTGKTTTLRIVLGLDQDFIGRVHRPDGAVGTMFQEPRLLPWLDVAANLKLVIGKVLPPGAIEDVLEEVGLPGAAQRYPTQLSLGMARRAALARALLVHPRLLVLDEPFSSLDPSLAAALASTVARSAQRAGATMLLATHSIPHALATTDRILVLHGRPATLSADMPVPPATDRGARAALRQELLARFPFLDPATGDEPGQEPERLLQPGR